MFCIKCSKLIERNRTINTLFKETIHSICENCIYNNLQHVDEVLIIPLENGYLACVIDLLEELNSSSYLYFSYFSKYFEIISKYINSFTLIYIDEFDEATYNIINKARLGNIIIVTLKTRGEILL